MVHGAMVPTNNMITFTGLCDSSIHRPGPEHVKLEHVKDGEIINTPTLAHYSRSSETIHSYNDMWRGARIYLYTGKGNLMFMGEVGISSLYFNTDLKKGEEYRITWACWPVGAEKAVEKEIIFKWNP